MYDILFVDVVSLEKKHLIDWLFRLFSSIYFGRSPPIVFVFCCLLREIFLHIQKILLRKKLQTNEFKNGIFG